MDAIQQSKLVNDDVWVPTVCQMCYSACGVKVHRVNGVVTQIEGNPDCPTNSGGKICAKGVAGLDEIYSPTRVKVPLKRTNPEKGIAVDPKWVEISWDEALDTIVQKLKKIREENPKKLMTMSFDLDYHTANLLQYAFGFGYGTPNQWTGGPRFWCGNNRHPIAFLTHGVFSESSSIKYCNYLILMSQSGFGLDDDANLMSLEMAEARERGMKVVVLDPIMNRAAAKADEWIPIRPGTDGAFALAVINTLINELEIYDAEFLQKYTNGPYLIGPDGHYVRDKATNKPLIWDAVEEKTKTFDDPSIKGFALEGCYKVDSVDSRPAFQVLKDHVKKYTCELAAEITTVPAQTIRRIAREFGEAARIGSTIAIDGKMLPYRPACVHWYKGPSGHKHSFWIGWAFQLMNMVVGAIDVPGGHIGVNVRKDPDDVCSMSWAPPEGPDGMVNRATTGYSGFPIRQVTRPESFDLLQLLPVAQYSQPFGHLVFLNRKKYNVPDYELEAILHSRTNMIYSTDNPKDVEGWLKKVPFQVTFAREIDEMTEFADIVLPDTCFLEQLDLSPNTPYFLQSPEAEEWYFMVRQPVVAPPPNVRYWNEVMFEEIVERIGIRKEVYGLLNKLHQLKEPYTLNPEKKYTWEEFIDTWYKSNFGPEHGLAWFKKHGVLKWPKKVEDRYPRPFIKPRIPIYLEDFLDLGKEVKRVADEIGYTWWDVSDYQAVPDWKPCPAYEDKSVEYDLYAVNFRLNYHTFTHTAYNSYLEEITQRARDYDLLINTETAKRKGIKDGDEVWVSSKDGDAVKGRVRTTEGVNPEVLGVPARFGHWAKTLPRGVGKGTHINSLYRTKEKNLDYMAAALDSCVKVKISKVS